MQEKNVNEAYKLPTADTQLKNYFTGETSVSKKASDSGLLAPYYRAGLEQALAKRSASLYGSQGVARGALGGAAAGAAVSQYKGKKVKGTKRVGGKTKTVGFRKTKGAGKVIGKGALGAGLGAVVGAAVGLYDPEAGMAMAPGGAGFLAGGLAGKGVGLAARKLRTRSAKKRFASSGTVAKRKPKGIDPYFKVISPSSKSSIAMGNKRAQKLKRVDALMKKGTQNYGVAAATGVGTVAATLAGKFYGYQSDRFERAKRGATDPSFGTTMTTPGIPGYSTF